MQQIFNSWYDMITQSTKSAFTVNNYGFALYVMTCQAAVCFTFFSLQ